MKESKITHNLLEYILTLLSIPENCQIDLDHLSREPLQLEKKSTMLNEQNIQTTYGLIRFMDEMPGGFLIYRADNGEEIIYANNALLRIFQCDTLSEFREFTGNSFKGFVYAQDLDIVEKSIKEQISNSQYDLDYVEYRIKRKDG